MSHGIYRMKAFTIVVPLMLNLDHNNRSSRRNDFYPATSPDRAETVDEVSSALRT